MRKVDFVLLASFLSVSALACKARNRGNPETEKVIASYKARFEALDLERRRALVQAMAELVPRPDLGPCPMIERKTVIAADAAGSGFNLERMERQAKLASRTPSLFPSPPTVEELPDRWGELFSAFNQDVKGVANLPPADAKAKLAKWDQPDAFDWDITVIKSNFEKTKADVPEKGKGTYDGGKFVGRAYVWSYTEKKAICAADISAELSGDLTIRTSKNASDDDKRRAFASKGDVKLAMQVEKQIVPNLWIAGPPLTQAGK